MAPPAATLPNTVDLYPTKNNATVVATTQYDVCEDYEGNYRFAPIEEAQVSRAMIKRLEIPDHHRMKSCILPVCT
jgi:thiamine thiazole synthase